MTKLLIDCDTIIYKGLFACEDRFYAGLRACDFTLDNILQRYNYPDYTLAMSGKGNFRKKLYPEYKANRDPNQRPKYLYEAKEYMKKYWGAVEAHGMEADDLLAQQHNEGTVLVVEDKDYKQLGGNFYNYWKNEAFEITNPYYYWYQQILCGDRQDNIPGCLNPDKLHHKNPPCFTNDTAGVLLEGKTKEEMKKIVQLQYKLVYGEDWFSKYDLTARLLWLVRDPNKNYYDYF